ncbi:restriction endonuclease subunit S [Streptomyces aureus]|uniref:restriction endonuclease subunit S n=1 Tax=Streptomyces aureus TaxID=193461 RepID=UPI0031DBB2B0
MKDSGAGDAVAIAPGEELPEGWVRAKLGELGEWYGGGTPSKRRPEFWADGTIPWLSPKDMGEAVLSGTQDLIHKSALNESPVKKLPAGSVVLVVRSGILERKVPVAYVPFEVTLNQDMKAVVPHKGIEARWLASMIKALERPILDRCRKQGTTVASLEVSRLMEMEIPVPPLSEQRRIVAKLDEQLAHVEAGAAASDAAQRLIRRLWSGVLQSLVTGEALAGVEAPEGKPVGEVAKVSGGIQKSGKRRPVENKFPFLRVANVPRGSLDLLDIHEIELFDGEIERHRLSYGDLLVVEGNGSPDQIGRAAMWRDDIKDCVHQNHLIRVSPGVSLVPEYLELVWNAPGTAAQLRAVAASTSGLYTLSTAKVKSIVIPVPAIKDQEALVRKAHEARLAIDEASSVVATATSQALNLRSALLSAALSGTLVPQDPTDEPASVLLDRIRAQRLTAVRPVRKRAPRKTTPPGQEELPQ